MLHDPLFFSLLWLIPFGGFLASLAFIPIFASKFWHQRFGIILGGWIASFIIPLVFQTGFFSTLSILAYTLLHHYVPFMALITVLYTIGGGIHISMKGKASPLINASILGFGAMLANLIGTMGASMLLIRPIIALNRYRHYRSHIIIFFIFLVANIGGVLTPLGDPPLFIGFLNGVDFFWTTTHLIYPFLMVGCAILVVFWAIDHYYFYHDPSVLDPDHLQGEAKITVKGQQNFLFLSGAIFIVIMESMITQKPHVTLAGLSINLAALIRDATLFFIAIASWKFTPSTVHEANRFTWAPLEEVAMVFLGIFITVIPVLGMLKAGEAGPLGSLILMANPHNIPDVNLYFWLTGLFSAFLDNAPTYLIFFNMAGGNPVSLMTEYAPILEAISLGAVFLGAMTYIGNAPNFVIRSIAIQSHIKMPGFLAYILWSSCILLPIFLIFSWFWFG